MNISVVPNDWIMVLTALVRDGGGMITCPVVQKRFDAIKLTFRQERKRRRLRKMTIYQAVDQKPEPNVRPDKFWSSLLPDRALKPWLPVLFLQGLTDDEVIILTALGSAVSDYSCLGGGVKMYAEALYDYCADEAKRRHLTIDDFGSLKMEA